jgi:DNA repair protein RecO (recombination protein O)
MAIELQQKAFVLYTRPLRETSLLVTFFTENKGKINAVVKGVRSNSKTARVKQAWLQPFQALNVSWVEKNNATSDLVNLRLLEPTSLRFPLVADANICGLYINELLYRLLYQSIASPSLYQDYQHSLLGLAKAENRQQQEWVLRQFEYALLLELGVAMDMVYDANNQLIKTDGFYQFTLEVGFQPIENSQNKVPEKISGKTLQQFHQRKYREVALPALKYLFRFVLAYYLGDKPIHTRNLFA